MSASDHKSGRREDVSWLMLLSIASIVVGTLWLLSYCVFYTEGEIWQGLFVLLVGAVAACTLIGFWERRIALWFIVVVGGALLLWQAYQIRKWTVIHEDIVAIVQFAEEARSKTGYYPTTLEGYTFKKPGVQAHIYGITSTSPDVFRITYFMNDPGITYWYSSKTGFGYYPD